MNDSKKPHPKYGTRQAKIIPVIWTRGLIGTGEESDPVRMQECFWKPDGTLIAKKEAKNY